jgi:hypothetical protein
MYGLGVRTNVQPLVERFLRARRGAIGHTGKHVGLIVHLDSFPGNFRLIDRTMPLPSPRGKRCRASPFGGSELFDRDFGLAEAVNEILAQAFHFAGDADAHLALQHFLDQHAQLQFGKARADTAMHAVAE